jgi:hypothetical protein
MEVMKMDSVTVNRSRVLAAFLPISAALLLIGEALMPKGLDQIITTKSTALTVLPIAAEHTNQVYIAFVMVICGLGALAVAFSSIATLVRGRGATLATTAAVLWGFSLFCGVMANVLVNYNLAATATAHLSRDVAARYLVATFTSWPGKAIVVGYLGGLVVASILMLIALWQSRSVPRWLIFLFAIGLTLGATAPPGPISIALQLPFAAAMILLASRIWQMAALPADGDPAPTNRTVQPDPVPTSA